MNYLPEINLTDSGVLTALLTLAALEIILGVMPAAGGFHQHFNKSYLCTAIAFSLIAEPINMRMCKNREAVDLNNDNL